MTPAQREQTKGLIRQSKDCPCADCGVKHPYYVMQFDHVEEGKVGNVSRLLRSKGLNTVLGEIEKCEVVCANCHAERTWRRQKVSA